MASIAGNKQRHKEHTLDVKYATLMEMTSFAGNKQRYNEHTLNVKYATLMEIDRGLWIKDVWKKFNVPKKHPAHVEKEQGKNNLCIQE